MTTAVIIQARWASTRLPGKVLETLGDKSVLAHVVSRASRIAGADVVVCAVPDDDASRAVADEAEHCGARVFRGSEQDVLARYAGAARMVSATRILRITSDCPLIDPQVCDDVLTLQARERCDYAANNAPPTFPHGLDCEAFTMHALEEAEHAAIEPFDREHVTPWLRRVPHLRRSNLAAKDIRHAHLRWTLDYPEDLAFLRAVMAEFPAGAEPDTAGILAVIARKPALAAINADRHQAR